MTRLTEFEENVFLDALANIDFVFFIPVVFGDASGHLAEEDLLACDFHWWASNYLERNISGLPTPHMMEILTINHKTVSL